MTPAEAQDLKDCITGPNPDAQIRGCSCVLNAFPHGYGKLTLDLLYFGRAHGYRDKRQAIADLDKSIEINPKNAEA